MKNTIERPTARRFSTEAHAMGIEQFFNNFSHQPYHETRRRLLMSDCYTEQPDVISKSNASSLHFTISILMHAQYRNVAFVVPGIDISPKCRYRMCARRLARAPGKQGPEGTEVSHLD